MHRTVHFRYAYPTAWEHDEGGDPVNPDGKRFAAQLAGSLEHEVTRASEVRRHKFYGWGFHTAFGKSVFYQVVNAVEPDVYITIHMRWYLIHRLLLRKPRSVFERYCGIVGVSLASTDGVSDICWEQYRR